MSEAAGISEASESSTQMTNACERIVDLFGTKLLKALKIGKRHTGRMERNLPTLIRSSSI